MSSIDEVLDKLASAVIEGDEDRSREYAKAALDLGVDPYDAIMLGCKKGMDAVSHMYDCKEMFVPEIMFSTDSMYAALEVLRPHICIDESYMGRGKVVIGVIEGDIHDIGKNLVMMMLEVAGYETIDLGRDTPIDVFAKMASEHDADIVAISALMTSSMPLMERAVKGIRDDNLRAKIMVGGNPVSSDYAASIGADGYGNDAIEAVRVANSLMNE